MPKAKAGHKPSPIVHVFVCTDRQLGEILAEMQEAAAPVIKAMRALLKARKQQALAPDARALAETVDPGGIDPNLLVLFHVVWAILSLDEGRMAEASSLLKRARSLVNRRTPAEIRTTLMTYEAHLLFYSGRKEQAQALLAEALAALPRSSPRYPLMFHGWAEVMAARGQGAEIEAEYARLVGSGAGPLNSVLAQGYKTFRMCHYGETGQLDKAAACMHAGPDAGQPLSANEAFWRCYIDVLQGRPGPDTPDWAAVLRELIAGRADQALYYARKEAHHNDSGFLYGGRFDAFNMIRAELASGRGEAARRLIRLRREMGNGHYLDDFFLARAELLSGNREEAARRFASAYAACRHYRAEGRLEIELRMACEMSRSDVMFLMAAVADPAAGPVANRSAAPEGAGEAPSGTERLQGRSGDATRVRQAVARIAPLDAPVLITGETGTGKELVARAIHESGPRSAEPFVATNCGAIAESLLESELFGHEKGAFTGAAAAHRGLFEEAGTGTILLDEIGEISPRLQVSLLRVMETGEIRPVGSARSRKIRCRIVAATNADLDALVEKGTFRKDLFYRLKRLEVRLPPLRERRADIIPLAEYFLAEGRSDRARPSLSAELRAELTRRRWPGNVRELRNAMERMRLLNSDRLEYGLAELRESEAGPSPDTSKPSAPAGPSEQEVAGMFKPVGLRLRRVQRARELFRTNPVLTRKAIIHMLGISQATATAYLKVLCGEGFIERVTPTPAPHTHYFRLRPTSPEVT